MKAEGYFVHPPGIAFDSAGLDAGGTGAQRNMPPRTVPRRSTPDTSSPQRLKARLSRVARLTTAAVAVLVVSYLILQLPVGSYLGSLLVSRTVARMNYSVGAGISPSLPPPPVGPYDERLGYTALPAFIRRMSARGFEIEQQARSSPALLDFTRTVGIPPYHEKSQAGLALRDRSGEPLETARYPACAYQRFDEIPAVLVDTLRFIEDRDLLDPTRPRRNPAIEWTRFVLAAAGRVGGTLDPHLRRGGASTVPTQMEKFRHSPNGRTNGVSEKLRQMATATARAYLDGPQTIGAQQEIVVSYLDSTPLGSRPGYGEIIGLGDGLLSWYGADFRQANRLLGLRHPSRDEAGQQGKIYKQALSLLIAQRRPAYYLGAGRPGLDQLTNAYLRGLAAAGVIDRELRDAALKYRLDFAPVPPLRAPESFVERKAADAVKFELMEALGLPDLYALDHLDLSADVTIDGAVQQRVTAVLDHLRNPGSAAALGLVGDHLLAGDDKGGVTWSVVLYERERDRNVVRIHSDSLDQPFDINSGAKLILGSTAKLRTLATYLGIVDDLQRELSGLPVAALEPIASTSADPLRRWAAGYLAGLPPNARGLQPMLDAAMQRRYSANPSERFFTGGGVHVFHNFDAQEDGETPTVEEAFERSINLAFVRLLRDMVMHFEVEGGVRELLSQAPGTAARDEVLSRFADEEGRVYLNRYYADYRGLPPDEALDRLSSHAHPGTRALAALFLSVRPTASAADFQRFLARADPGGYPEKASARLFDDYQATRFPLTDRAFLAGVHPLELWLVEYLDRNPGATESSVIQASAEARQQAYAWLFRTKNSLEQDLRLRIIAEQDAFDRILEDWRRQGYPFGHLIPSLATAIGSSGDRPDALATLVGVILNGGVRNPTTDLERVHFASGTPYDTLMARRSRPAERVMSAEVAATLRRALIGVVEKGTGSLVRGAFVDAEGMPLAVGGKTGTGDNRLVRFGTGGQPLEALPVDRTATFVFFLGDRYYGTVTAVVSGRQAGNYHFSSALAVALLKALVPEMRMVARDGSGWKARMPALPIASVPGPMREAAIPGSKDGSPTGERRQLAAIDTTSRHVRTAAE